MSTHNVVALLNMYRLKNVAAVRTRAGIIFMGMRNITPSGAEGTPRNPTGRT